MLLTENGPILMLTSCASIVEAASLDALERRGIEKFIAYEVPVNDVHDRYGLPFEVLAGDLEQGARLRVLDFDGSQIFRRCSFSQLGPSVRYEH
jgi:hypothetical protein